MNKIERIAIQPAALQANANISPLYSIEKASWIWHPDCKENTETALLFRNDFVCGSEMEIILHVTADQRWELSLDGETFSMGPDRSDTNHWSFHSYRINLPVGSHRFEALVWWIGTNSPVAQTSVGARFLVATENAGDLKLDTGSEGWRVKQIQGWSFRPALNPHFVGATHIIDARKTFAPGKFVVPSLTMQPLKANPYGLMTRGRRLYPSPLPEQIRRNVRAGRVRAILADKVTSATALEETTATPEATTWNTFLKGERPLRIPARSIVSALIDLEDYYCAYPRMTISGGKNTRITVSWAESLYVHDRLAAKSIEKGNRDQVGGKHFLGVDDVFISDGGKKRVFQPCWWRSGRYVLVTVETSTTAVKLDDFCLVECRYPLENTGSFAASDGRIGRAIPLLVRGMQMCAHETYMDCPYHEQLMYVGDTRVEMLTGYVMTGDDRLTRRGIELFDWSRHLWEMVAEHYPSRTPQLSPTFSLIWISMVRDYAFWRNDIGWIRTRMPGVRAVMEQFRMLIGETGLLAHLPGWPFVDWVHGWNTGNAPVSTDGISSINNLFFVQALRDAADLEDACGEWQLAERNRMLAAELAERIVRTFWVPGRRLLADDTEHKHFSEHAQCLAIINGIFDHGKAGSCFDAMVSARDLSKASVYFSFYLFEAFRKFGRGDLILAKLDFWHEMIAKGLKTPLEAPEPSRSDCHAWGSHPLFHLHASVAGIRPIQPGFQRVDIAPLPGKLGHIECRTPHPRGWIELSLDFPSSGPKGTISLPTETTGIFRFAGAEQELLPGEQTHIGS